MEYFDSNNYVINFYKEKIELDAQKIPLKGVYQKYNSALAVLTIIKTALCDKKVDILNGIKNVVKNTNLTGRYEVYNIDPTLILDSAHNIAGITQFLSEFDKEKSNYKKNIVLFGAMKDKAHTEMLIELNKSFDEIHLTEIDYERSAKIEDLKAICNKLNITSYEVRKPVEFVHRFLEGTKEHCLVVLGSMYLLGEVKIGLQQ